MVDLFYDLMEQGIFMALFIVLLVYTTKKTEERENRYINIINELIQRSGENGKENIIK